MERHLSIHGLLRRREELLGPAREEPAKGRRMAESLRPLFQRCRLAKAYPFGSEQSLDWESEKVAAPRFEKTWTLFHEEVEACLIKLDSLLKR